MSAIAAVVDRRWPLTRNKLAQALGARKSFALTFILSIIFSPGEARVTVLVRVDGRLSKQSGYLRVA